MLGRPVPIVFAACQMIQQLANGTWNLLGVFDKLTLFRLPDGTTPDTVTIPVLTVWTGGQGNFTGVIRVVDEDGNELGRVAAPFVLQATNIRSYMLSYINMPAQARVLTLTVGLSDGEELLRQDFTI